MANSSISLILGALGALTLWPDWESYFELGERDPALSAAVEQLEAIGCGLPELRQRYGPVEVRVSAGNRLRNIEQPIAGRALQPIDPIPVMLIFEARLAVSSLEQETLFLRRLVDFHRGR